MKVKLFVDWYDRKIFKEEEYEKEIAECAKDREKDDYEFAEFLDDYLERICGCRSEKLAHLFGIDKAEREKILKLWKEDCLETVRNNSDDYEEIEIEL